MIGVCNNCKKSMEHYNLIEMETEVICLDCLKEKREWFIKETGMDKTHFVCNVCLAIRMNEFMIDSESFGKMCTVCSIHITSGLRTLFKGKSKFEKGKGEYITINWVEDKT